MRRSTEKMRQEYEAMAERYDSLEMILDNITERDKSVFRILFESDPYNLDIEESEARLALYEKNISKSKRQLTADLNQSIDNMNKKAADLEASWNRIKELGDELGDKSQNIPSIQPVLNNQLTLITAGYGNILNPFYRTLKSHQGVDYTIAEGSSVFATADGVVREISDKNSTLGKTIIIDHGNGYKTSYSHLLSTLVRRGQKVQRGDVIALTGNSGLSLAPHLHYEVRYNDLRVDPIHYFFMELTPDEYQRIIRIAQSGMQSFD
jgi:murein DD-endopeptidase MepM/ murein hydrolase activator NlpD